MRTLPLASRMRSLTRVLIHGGEVAYTAIKESPFYFMIPLFAKVLLFMLLIFLLFGTLIPSSP